MEKRKLSAADYLASVLERESVAVGERLLRVGLNEDWRALAFLIERAYGKATERVESVRAVETMSLEELRGMRDRLLAEYPDLRASPQVAPREAQA